MRSLCTAKRHLLVSCAGLMLVACVLILWSSCLRLELCLDHEACRKADPNRPFCVAAKCITCPPKQRCCKVSNDCIQNESCEEGLCRAPSCSQSQDCKDGKICRNQQCRACTQSSECPTPQTCQSGQCAPDCSDTRPCAHGLVCTKGECLACAQDNPCPDPQRCVEGTCQPKACAKEADCQGGHVCRNGECSPCQNDNDCQNTGSTCSKGRCLRIVDTSKAPPYTWNNNTHAQSCLDYATTNDYQKGATTAQAYLIQPALATTPFTVWCELLAEDGNWTLAMKIDGKETTFAYDSPQWTSSTPYQPDFFNVVPNTPNAKKETKLESYRTIPVRQIMLRRGLNIVVVSLPRTYPSLLALFGQQDYILLPSVAKLDWKNFLGAQPEGTTCRIIPGINAQTSDPKAVRVRIGLLGAADGACEQPPTAWLGIGGGGDICGKPSPIAAGFVSSSPGCSSPSQQIDVLTQLFIREREP